MSRKTLKDVFIHLLADTYSAEKQLVRALPRLARAATDPRLATIFAIHLDDTRTQLERIDRVIDSCQVKPRRMKCVVMESLVEEAQQVIDEIDKGPVLDSALVAAAQKIEHHEIASYGSLVELAKQLGFLETQLILAQTLQEEIGAARKLTQVAQGGVNQEALAEVATP